jgi:N-acyl-D-aspartate/D-glutamate deacylase
MSTQPDIIVRNGTVVDGSGRDPFIADVAVQAGRICGVGRIRERGIEEIDASGLLVTPGFVDIHTHYDAQAMWDERLQPSSGHGVTTVVMGNCGVGFAPCRARDRERLVRLMEGVEDIPGVVMAEGLSWEWETYPEYLAAVEKRRHDINLASYLPHSPLRVYVMGERAAAGEPATAEDIAQMADITREAMQAGALGFASSRTLFHRSSDGELIPTLDAGEAELRAIARAMQSAGAGILQIADDYKNYTDLAGAFALLKGVARDSGRLLSLPMGQNHAQPQRWRELLALIEQANAEGVNVNAQVMPRGIGLLFGLELSSHAFCLSPSYQAIAHLPLAERIQRMRDPVMKSRLLSEATAPNSQVLVGFTRSFEGMFEVSEPLDYEPLPGSSIGARAAREGIAPLELAYEILLRHGGEAALYLPFANYAHGNLDVVRELLRHKHVRLGLGDGGAHCGIICDASYPTFLLSYWTRDRVRGERLEIPQVVRAMSRDTAEVVGLLDRGLIAPGYVADLNVIDYDSLHLHGPKLSFDLPAGGRRLTQRADGYVATIVSGKVVYRDGNATGALPGELVRGQRRDCGASRAA